MPHLAGPSFCHTHRAQNCFQLQPFALYSATAAPQPALHLLAPLALLQALLDRVAQPFTVMHLDSLRAG